jgi:hypothetical protein
MTPTLDTLVLLAELEGSLTVRRYSPSTLLVDTGLGRQTGEKAPPYRRVPSHTWAIFGRNGKLLSQGKTPQEAIEEALRRYPEAVRESKERKVAE